MRTLKKNPHDKHVLAIDHFAMGVVARLDQGLTDLPHDVTERLRAGRVQALATRKKPVTAIQTASNRMGLGSVLSMGEGRNPKWWMPALTAIPIVVLMAGVMFMASEQNDSIVAEVAEIDSAILTDALPPSAYADPGFVQYLKVRSQEFN